MPKQTQTKGNSKESKMQNRMKNLQAGRTGKAINKNLKHVRKNSQR
jgi:hypothetical protein